ncbi:MAG TPA: CHAT domain-containing protein, partial [Micromonosporaceae bacterium]|nr:CHAT domain-containing protein [Micromonosporaceae bacterium]
ALDATRGRRPATPGPALVVAVPDERVPSVETEVARLTALLPDATVLAGPDATRERVLSALADHPVVHVAGHAVSDRADPDASRLLLHDGPLTVADLRGLHLVGAELAFLSACATSRTRPALVDEAVHLTAAFQLAGYRHVVGTWWPVNDSVAANVAGDVYAELTARGTRAPETAGTALALHRAVLQLRADFPDRPSLWAAHGHTGL